MKLTVNVVSILKSILFEVNDSRSFSATLIVAGKAWKNSGLNETRNPDLCDTGTHQLSYRAKLELIVL